MTGVEHRLLCLLAVLASSLNCLFIFLAHFYLVLNVFINFCRCSLYSLEYKSLSVVMLCDYFPISLKVLQHYGLFPHFGCAEIFSIT